MFNCQIEIVDKEKRIRLLGRKRQIDNPVDWNYAEEVEDSQIINSSTEWGTVEKKEWLKVAPDSP